MRRVPRVIGRVLGALALVLALIAAAGADDETEPAVPDADAGADCGTKALSFLLRLEGKPVAPERIGVTLDEVARAAGARGSGHSLRELRDGAGRLGVALDGVRWSPGVTPPPGPMIAFLNRQPHGHFVAIRPVGHTGRLVQILDGEADPEVIDAARLPTIPGWTGLVLAPHRANWGAWGVGAVLALAIVGWPGARGWWSRRRAIPAA